MGWTPDAARRPIPSQQGDIPATQSEECHPAAMWGRRPAARPTTRP